MAYDRSACFLMRPRGAFRFGSHADDLTGADAFPGSDTLFGALAWAVSAREGSEAVGRWVQSFADGKPPVLISSGLPYHRESGTPLVPRPQRRRAEIEGAEVDRKLVKRAEYVDTGALAWFAGNEAAAPVAARRLLVSAGSALPRVCWSTSLVPGVAVDRASSASSVYSVAVTRYALDVAVYVLGESEGDIDALEPLFDILAVTGIGGRRSRGAGVFTWERVECPLRVTARPAGPALSLVWPRREEIAQGALSPPEGYGYRITERQGWIGSGPWQSERTRKVAMLGEGSYLSPSLPEPVGGLVDVTPADARGRHAVYRYGYGLFLDEGLA